MIKRAKSFLVNTWKTQRALCLVWAGVFVYTAFFTSISVMRYAAFSFDDFDFGLFVHESWKAVHGSGHISMLNDVPIWGNALELISFVTVPLYLFFGMDPRGLLFWQSFALGAGAIPIFLIARNRLPEPMAVFWAFSYLCYPAMWYCNVYEYYPIVYATFTLLMAFYCFDQKRFGWFMLFIILSLLNRVDVGIVTVMYGVYAFALKRSWRWVVWPILVSVLWVFIGLFIVIPHFNTQIFHDSYYSQFGDGFDEIIKNMILHPGKVWKLLATPENGKYFYEMFYPALFLPIVGLREFLICSLSLLQHLASNRLNEHTIYYHYTATITPFVFIAAIHGMAFIHGKRKLGLLLSPLPLMFTIYANFLYGPLSHPEKYVHDTRVDAEDIYKKKMLSDVPKNVPVVSTFEFSPMLAGRNRFYSFHFIYRGLFLGNTVYETPRDIEYAMVNFLDRRLFSFGVPDSDLLVLKFLNEGNFRVIDRINSVVLFGKGKGSSPKLFDSGPPSDLAEQAEVVENRARLVSFDHQLIKKRGQNVLSLTLRWRPKVIIEGDFSENIAIFDSKGKNVYQYWRKPCYHLYPASRWKAGEEITDPFDLLLPLDLKAGEYTTHLLLVLSGVPLHIDMIEGNALAGKPNVSIQIGKFTIHD